mgnify:CR=1 FL=1
MNCPTGEEFELRKESLDSIIATYLLNNRDFMDGIRLGLRDWREGKVRPWEEIKEVKP